MPFLDNIIYKGEVGGSVAIPDSRIPVDLKPVVHACVYCGEQFLSEDELKTHRLDIHPIKRPTMLFRGRPLRREELVIRSMLSASDIEFINTEKLIVDGLEEIDASELAEKLLRCHSGIINIELWHQTYPVTYKLRFDIYEESVLERTEAFFFEAFGGGRTLVAALELFNDKVTSDGGAKPYAAALGAYITGIMTKDRLPEAWLNFDEYPAKLGEAYDGLEEYNRPLAQSVISIIRFMWNDFSIMEVDVCLPKLKRTKDFFSGGVVGRAPEVDSEGMSIPIDRNTEVLINFCCSSESQQGKSVDGIIAIYKASLSDSKDRIKAAFILWEHYRKSELDGADHYKRELTHSSFFGSLIERLESN